MADAKGFVVEGEQDVSVYFEVDEGGQSKQVDFRHKIVDNKALIPFKLTHIPLFEVFKLKLYQIYLL